MIRASRLLRILPALLAAGCASNPGGPAPDDPGDLPKDPESLHPVLKWAAFPPEGDRIGRFGPTDVTYDLRIYRQDESRPGHCVPIYSRDGLTEAFHRVEIPLDPDCPYAWTYRARFRVNGSPRHTPWAERGGLSRTALLGLFSPIYLPLGEP